MSRTEARGYYDKQAGDPDQGYIVPTDAQAAIDVTYRDMEAGDQAVVHQLHNRVPDFATAGDPGAVLMLEGPQPGQTIPVWSDNLNATINRVTNLETRANNNDTAHAGFADKATLGGLLTTKGDLAGRAAANAVRIPVGANETVLEADSTAAAGVKWGAAKAAKATIGNLLTDAQATFAGAVHDAAVTTVGWSRKSMAGSTSNFSQVATTMDTAVLCDGYPTIRLEKTDGTAIVNGQATPSIWDNRVPVTPGETVTALMKFRQEGGGTQTVSIRVGFVDAAGVLIPSAVEGNRVAAEGVWVESMVVAVAPAGAVTATICPLTTGTSAVGGKMWMSKPSIHIGAGGPWRPPGLPIPNTGRRVSHPNGDDVLVEVWDSTLGRWQRSHYDSGWRDITANLINGWAVGATGSPNVRLRRVNDTVTLSIPTVSGNAALVGAAATSAAFVNLGAGFGFVGGNYPRLGFLHDVSSDTGMVFLKGNGASARQLQVLPNSFRGTIGGGETSWSTNDAIPTSLPGTLITAAPN